MVKEESGKKVKGMRFHLFIPYRYVTTPEHYASTLGRGGKGSSTRCY